MRNMRMDGRTVVIVGASSGMARGAALALGRLGANVVVFARRGDALDDLAAEIERDGGRALAVAGDISSSADIDRLAQAAVSRFDRIDVWINSVGIGSFGSFWAVPLRDHVRVAEVNFIGFLHGAHTAVRLFLQQGGGTLINIASVEGEVPLAYHSSYAATKAAVQSLTRALRQELRLAGRSRTISVASILPWAIDTPFWLHAGNHTGHAPRMAFMEDPAPVVDAIVKTCVRPRVWRTVGLKARAAWIAHRIAPALTDRVSADIIGFQTRKGIPAPDTAGALYEPVPGGLSVEGGVRERMRREDRGEVVGKEPTPAAAG